MKLARSILFSSITATVAGIAIYLIFSIIGCFTMLDMKYMDIANWAPPVRFVLMVLTGFYFFFSMAMLQHEN